MAQKDKVKELVGRSLDSYHTKALQQIDRIEKKNKEQNHKINILTNELDNDYLTKTEEGSVVSLEHSKEGMVYLDELQGNTLVNYCPDGAKELTLNGDIDVEGTNVTLNDAVDNGLVDVVCEGNTLVNLISLNNFRSSGVVQESIHIYKMNGISTTPNFIAKFNKKPNNGTTLTYFAEFSIPTGATQATLTVRDVINNYTYNLEKIPITNQSSLFLKGLVNIKHNSFSDESGLQLIFDYDGKELNKNIDFTVSNFILLEGDWTNKETPPYFEGMKSVGECEDNKIEILSTSSMPNLLLNSRNFKGLNEGTDTGSNQVDYIIENGEEFTRFTTNKETHCNHYWYIKPTEPRRANETYTISFDYRCSKKWNGYWYPSDSFTGEFFPNTNNQWKRGYITKTLTTNSDSSTMLFGVSSGGSIGDTIDIKNIKLEKGSTPTRWLPNVNDTEYTLAKYTNKKEISLNEPLRALPNGVKDKIVKIGGKHYVERNCGNISLVKLLDFISNAGTTENYIRLCFSGDWYNIKEMSNCLCDTIQTYNAPLNPTEGKEIISTNTYLNYIYINVYTSNVEDKVSAGKERIRELNPTLIYELATPIYEELPIDPTLNTYNDITHISNNSTIPCNMTVKNTGYNAIIKPSTQYTVAFDSNKSGEVGINLAGSKVTTNNNVATVTTPSTLVDDTLRLTGKSIKASKVRLIEGDKTNWIPSHFEGMKSSFEDKLQEDGTYKMEILSNNKNLCIGIESGQYNTSGVKQEKDDRCRTKELIKVKPNSLLQISGWTGVTSALAYVHLYDSNKKHIERRTMHFTQSTGTGAYTVPNNVHYIAITKDSCVFNNQQVQIEYGTVATSYTSHKSNKIQFSSIEPLRSVGDVKDRFVFKEDGKLMIERNCGHYIFNENTPWIGTDYTNKGHWIRVNDNQIPNYKPNLKPVLSIPSVTDSSYWDNNDNELEVFWDWTGTHMYIFLHSAKTKWDVKTKYNGSAISDYMKNNPIEMVYELLEPTYEEIPFELQKIILECYENGTLFFDTNIPPTITTTYAGETPIVKSTRLNKTEVLKNTDDINDNIVPYLMDMDYRVVCLQLEGGIENISMARLFGGAFEMLQRDILSSRYSKEEYKYRLDAYLSANKITENEYEKLGDMLNE